MTAPHHLRQISVQSSSAHKLPSSSPPFSHIKVDHPRANQSDQNITQLIDNDKSILDIFVKIKFRDFDKMIEASEQIDNVNNKWNIIIKGECKRKEKITREEQLRQKGQAAQQEKEAKERKKQEKQKEEAAQQEKETGKQENNLLMATFINKTHQIISQQLSKHLQQEKAFKSISPVNASSLIQKSDQAQQLASSSSQASTIFIIIIIVLAIVAIVLLFNTAVLLNLLRAQQKKQSVRTSNSLSEEQSSQKITKDQSNIMS